MENRTEYIFYYKASLQGRFTADDENPYFHKDVPLHAVFKIRYENNLVVCHIYLQARVSNTHFHISLR